MENMKRFRSDRFWSQARLSVESGVSIGMIGEIETGRKNPSIDTLDKIAGAFGISTYRLLMDEQSGQKNEKDHKKQQIIKLVNEL